MISDVARYYCQILEQAHPYALKADEFELLVCLRVVLLVYV